MTPADEKYFNDAFTMFRSDGWKALMEEMEQTKSQLNNLSSIKTAESFQHTKGMDSVVRDILSLEARTLAAYEDASTVDAEESDFA